MSLTNLLAEMEVFAKALAAPPEDPEGKQDDKDILAAAGGEDADEELADGADDGPGDDGDADDAKAGAADADDGTDGDAGGADKPPSKDAKLTKSLEFEFEMPDGTKAKGYDATEMLTAMQANMESLRAESTGVMQQAFVLIKSQATEIETLKQRIGELASLGRGRKTVVTVTEKVAASGATPLAKSSIGAEPSGMTPDEFFAKAESAQKAGRLSAADISVAEAYMNKGQPIPARIVSRVLAG